MYRYSNFQNRYLAACYINALLYLYPPISRTFSAMNLSVKIKDILAASCFWELQEEWLLVFSLQHISLSLSERSIFKLMDLIHVAESSKDPGTSIKIYSQILQHLVYVLFTYPKLS